MKAATSGGSCSEDIDGEARRNARPARAFQCR
jgi:hypothetical protein